MSSTFAEAAPTEVRVDRWPSERWLRFWVVLLAIGIWLVLAVSLIGLAYAVLLGLAFFFAHLAFITHVRGSAVKLGPEQLPELHRRVVELSNRLGLEKVPDAYLLQAGGALNALATRFLGKSFIVLYSDLLDACGENHEARDMIIAHELGHLKAGHLKRRWLLIPGLAMPFLGTAYSRACEYTSDRYGMAVARDRDAALRGLAILAAGGREGRAVDLGALARQRDDLNSPWMKIGQWLATHPPIAHRLAAIDPGLAPAGRSGRMAALGAAAILALLAVLPVAGVGLFAAKAMPAFEKAMQDAQARAAGHGGGHPQASIASQERVKHDLLALATVVEAHRRRTGRLPANQKELYSIWAEETGGRPEPLSPYDGARYQYFTDDRDYEIVSRGADPSSQADDLVYDSRRNRDAK